MHILVLHNFTIMLKKSDILETLEAFLQIYRISNSRLCNFTNAIINRDGVESLRDKVVRRTTL